MSRRDPRPLLGDEAALYRRLQPRLMRRLRGRVRAHEGVLEDACSFAWVQLLRRQPSRSEILGWLYVVACHEAWRLLELERRAPTMEQELLELAAGGRDEGPLRDAAREALQALAALPERQRALLAGQVAGLTYAELAELEGGSRRAVERHLCLARAGVRSRRGANVGRQTL